MSKILNFEHFSPRVYEISSKKLDWIFKLFFKLKFSLLNRLPLEHVAVDRLDLLVQLPVVVVDQPLEDGILVAEVA